MTGCIRSLRDARYDSVETYLCGFDLPHEDINSNCYLLWHPMLNAMSMQSSSIAARMLPHQPGADHYAEHPKRYWQNRLVYMHCMRLKCEGRRGNGDPMDARPNHHIRKFGR